MIVEMDSISIRSGMLRRKDSKIIWTDIVEVGRIIECSFRVPLANYLDIIVSYGACLTVEKIDLCNLLSSSDTGLNDSLIRSIVSRMHAWQTIVSLFE